MAGQLTLLGFTTAEAADGIRRAMANIAGPALVCATQAGVAALAQTGVARPRPWQGRAGLLRKLSCVQLRLELACQTGPFLPADPAHALCAASALPGLLRAAADELAAAIAALGQMVQWDIALRWPAEPVLRAHRAALAAATGTPTALAEAVQGVLLRDRAERAAALRAALAGCARAVIDLEQGDTCAAVTVLVPKGADAALEAALMSLPASVADGVAADLRGPLPPLSFSPVRIAQSSAAEVEAAWQRLDLPMVVDDPALRRSWRAQAFQLHPDRGGATPAAMAEAGAAFRLLRGLLPAQSGGSITRAAIHSLAAPRLLVPALHMPEALP